MRAFISLLALAAWSSTTAQAANPRFPSFVPVPSPHLPIERDRGIDSPTVDPNQLLDANGCPRIVSPALCVVPAFLASACGMAELYDEHSQCHSPFHAHMTSWASQSPQGEVIDPITGEIVTVSFEDAPEDIAWQGFEGSFGNVFLTAVYPPSPAAQADRADRLAWWDQNCSVQSCEEYAHEGFRDYSQFEARIAPYLAVNDWRGVYEQTYGPEGIASRPLYNSDGERLPDLPIDLPRSRTIPGLPHGRRNAFVGWSPGDAHVVPELPGFVSQFGSWQPSVLALFALEMLRELPAAASDPTAPTRIKDSVIVDVLQRCVLSDLSGLMVCAPGSLAASQQVATRFNSHLRGFLPAQTTQLIETVPTMWPPADVDPWDFHAQVNDTLSGSVSDATLLWLERRQQQFLSSARTRAAAWDDISLAVYRHIGWDGCVHFQDETTCVDPIDPLDRLRQAFATLGQADTTLQALLDLGEDHACFGPAPTPCDWSPRWPALAVTGHFEFERELLYQTCITRTGNDFRLLFDEDPSDADPHWLTSQDDQRRANGLPGICASIPDNHPEDLSDCEVMEDYLRSPRTVRAYFDTLDAWITTLDLQTDPETGRPVIGDEAGDRSKLGNDSFYAVLDYGAGWALTGLDGGACDVGVQSWGRLRAGAKVFDVAVPPSFAYTLPPGVVDAGAVAARRAEGNLFFADLYGHASPAGEPNGGHAVVDLLGVNLFAEASAPATASGIGGYTFHFAEAVSGNEQLSLLDGERTFFIGPVPVNLKAGVAGTASISAEVSLTAQTCANSTNTAEAHGQLRFTPSIGAFAFADVSAGLSGLAAIGVDADLTLVEASLPFTFSTDAVLDPNGELPGGVPESELDLLTTLDLELTLLRGQMRLYVEFLFERFSRTVLNVSGIQQTYPLFDAAWNVDLQALVTAIGSLGGSHPDLPNDGLPPDAEPSLVIERGVCEDGGRPQPDVYFGFDDAQANGTGFDAEVGQAALLGSPASAGFSGVHGQAARTTSDGMDATPASVFPLGNHRAWSLWARPAGSTSTGVLVAHGTQGATPSGLLVRRLSSGAAQLSLACANGTTVTTTGGLLPGGAWSQVGVVALPADDGHILYVNGAQVGRTARCLPSYSGVDVHVGQLRRPAGVTERFAGDLDELGYWGSTALLGADMRDLYAQGLAGLPLAGEGSAPLSGISNLSGSVSSTTLSLSWTNPPSLSDPLHGYNQVVLRVGTTDYPSSPSQGAYGYAGTADAAAITVGGGDDILKVSSFALDGNGAVRAGPRIEVRRPLVSLPDVTNLTAIPGSDRIRLTWDLPVDLRVQDVVVRRAAAAPPSSPSTGLAVFTGRAREVLDTGLAPDTTWHYAVWTRDGYGRLSPGRTLTASTVSGIVPDTTPPGALTNTAAEVGMDAVWLSWVRPSDPDTVRVEVRRQLLGFPATTLFLGSATGFDDTTVLPGLAHTYTLTPLDPSGNRGPSVVLHATPHLVPPLAVLQATPATGAVDLGAIPSNPGIAQQIVVVRGTSAVSAPHNGKEVCRLPQGVYTCSDTTVVPNTSYVYTGFVLDGTSTHSAGVSAGPVGALPVIPLTIEAPASALGGELAHITATSTGTLASPVWTQVSGPDVRIVGARTATPWFRVPAEVGTVQLSLQAIVDGQATTKTVDIDVFPYLGATTTLAANPFLDLILQGRDGLHMAYDGNAILVSHSAPGGDHLSILSATGSFLADHPGDWPTVRMADAGRVLLADDYGTMELWDFSLGTPFRVGTETLTTAWAGDWKSGRLAYAHYSAFPSLRVAWADGAGFRQDGVLDGIGSAVADVALSDDGDTLYVAVGSDIHVYDLLTVTGLGGGSVVTIPHTPVATLQVASGTITTLKVDGDRMVAAHVTYSFPDTVQELSLYDLADPLDPVWVDGVSDAPENPQSGRFHGDLFTVVGAYEAQVYDLTSFTLARIPGVFPAGVPGISDAIVASPPGGATVWVAGHQYNDGGDTGIQSHNLNAGLDSLSRVLLPTVQPVSAISGVTSFEDHVAWNDGINLTYGNASTIASSMLGSPIFGTMCMDDDDLLTVTQDTPPTVQRRNRTSGSVVASWAGPSGCSAYTCTGDVMLWTCGTSLQAYDRQTGMALGGTSLSATPYDMVRTTEGEVTGVVQGQTTRLFLPGPGGLVTASGHGATLLGYSSGTQPTLWRSALFTSGSNGLERYGLITGATGLSPSLVIDTPYADFRVDAAAGQVVARQGNLLQAHWLDEGVSDTTLAALLPTDAGFGLTVDGGIAHTMEISDVVVHPMVGLRTHAASGSVTPGGTITIPVTLDGPAPATAALTCEVTGGTCSASRTGPLSATVSWTLPNSPGHHELLVVAGDTRWLLTTRERLNIPGAP